MCVHFHSTAGQPQPPLLPPATVIHQSVPRENIKYLVFLSLDLELRCVGGGGRQGHFLVNTAVVASCSQCTGCDQQQQQQNCKTEQVMNDRRWRPTTRQKISRFILLLLVCGSYSCHVMYVKKMHLQLANKNWRGGGELFYWPTNNCRRTQLLCRSRVSVAAY